MKFYAELPQLDQIMAFLRQEAAKVCMKDKAIHKLELACEEAIVNIISYAYSDKKGELSVECQKNGQRFEITLQDWGIPFNPIEAEVHPQHNLPVQERRIGGLGIYLLRKTIDEASYQRIGNANVLRLVFVI